MNKPNHLLRLFVLPLLRLWQRAPILRRFAAHFKIAIRFESNFADGARGRALVRSQTAGLLQKRSLNRSALLLILRAYSLPEHSPAEAVGYNSALTWKAVL